MLPQTIDDTPEAFLPPAPGCGFHCTCAALYAMGAKSGIVCAQLHVQGYIAHKKTPHPLGPWAEVYGRALGGCIFL